MAFVRGEGSPMLGANKRQLEGGDRTTDFSLPLSPHTLLSSSKVLSFSKWSPIACQLRTCPLVIGFVLMLTAIVKPVSPF